MYMCADSMISAPCLRRNLILGSLKTNCKIQPKKYFYILASEQAAQSKKRGRLKQVQTQSIESEITTA